MTAPRIIIFGGTGNVGSATTRTAQELGAKVFLAMRDTQKPIPGLSRDQERAAGIERVEADLTKPETVEAAVRNTGATRAFIYAVPASQDHMRSAIEALKAAGVDFVVMLSSATVLGDIRSIPLEEFAAYMHAQIEIGLDEVFGPGAYVAVRPAFFASNTRWWAGAGRAGKVGLAYPDAKVDLITPGDIGRVSGTLLVDGPPAVSDGTTSIALFGPQLVSYRDILGIIGRAIGKDIKVSRISEQEEMEWMTKGVGMPEPVMKGLFRESRLAEENGGYSPLFQGPAYENAMGNVQKYGRKKPTTFPEWVEENKHEFAA